MIEVVKLALLNEKVKNPINFQNTPSSNGSNINKEVATIAKKETKVTQKKTKALTPNTRTKSKRKSKTKNIKKSPEIPGLFFVFNFL